MISEHNDNEGSSLGRSVVGPDPHGQAALLLVESLVHVLIERNVITVEDAVEVLEVAAEVKVEIARDSSEETASLNNSLNLLAAIEASLKQDIVNR